MANRLEDLESLRGFAAAYVVVHHAHLLGNSGLGSLLYFGQEAVILFFLLSGFVVYTASVSSDRTRVRVGTYLIHRVRRIFPLLLLSLLVTYLCASMVAGRPVNPRWPNLLQNVLMMQDVSALKRGVWADTYYGNSPLWSLSYEWWFYCFFVPLELFGAIDWRVKLGLVATMAILGACTYQMHPNQASLFVGYFIIWWVGVEAAREYRQFAGVTLERQKLVLGLLILSAVLWTIPAVVGLLNGMHLQFGVDPVLQGRHFLAAAMIVGIGLVWRRFHLYGFRYTIGPFRIFAPVSYSLYLLHVPILAALEHFGVADPWARMGCAVLLLLPLCYVLEVRLQRVINRWSDRVFSPRRHSGALAVRSV